MFCTKIFFFNIFCYFNPNHAYGNQRRLFSGNLPGMFINSCESDKKAGSFFLHSIFFISSTRCFWPPHEVTLLCFGFCEVGFVGLWSLTIFGSRLNYCFPTNVFKQWFFLTDLIFFNIWPFCEWRLCTFLI